jgi:hypothetical protein
VTLALPAPLAPWAAELAGWPLETSKALAPWLPRLALAIGPALQPRAHADGAPEGYAGLARRGPYDRLLVSEWLLADELPDEFVRRAAAGEHLFLHLARRRPAGHQRTVVLFDAGPEQLGAPRLAHLAVLVVLAARARTAGRSFAFGVIQTPEAGLLEELNPQSARRLLEARTLVAPAPAHARAWQPLLGDGAGDLWVVGGAELVTRGFAPAAQGIEVEEASDPRQRRLQVGVRRAGRTQRPIELELPAAVVGARLLLDPFVARAPRSVASTQLEVAPIHFSANGNRVLARTTTGVASLGVPNQAGRANGRAGLFATPPGHTLVAADVFKRRLVTLTRAPNGRFVVHGIERAPEGAWLIAPVAEFVPPADERAPLSPIVFTPNGQDRYACVVDARGQVFTLDLVGGTVTAEPVRALAFAAAQRLGYVVGRVDGATGRDTCQAAVFAQRTMAQARPILGDIEQAFIGYSRTREASAMVAVRHADGAWRLPFHHPESTHAAPGEVVGAISVHIHGVGPRPFLLVVDTDRRTLRMWWTKESLPIASEAQPIVHACAASDLPRVAYQLADGTIVVSGLGAQGQLIRHAPGGVA